MSTPGVGIIGLGEVAQLMHLPVLTGGEDYGDYPVVYEYPFDDIARVDAGLDRYAKRIRMHLLYDTPSIVADLRSGRVAP